MSQFCRTALDEFAAVLVAWTTPLSTADLDRTGADGRGEGGRGRQLSLLDGNRRLRYRRSMAGRKSQAPQIVECRWGVIRVAGGGTFKDAKLYPGGAREWDWNETRTRHVPGIQPADVVELIERGATTIVLSRGVLRMLQVCP
ncbi:MAG: hypothetical protein ACREJT_09140, partial [Myxococcota bacterium]